MSNPRCEEKHPDTREPCRLEWNHGGSHDFRCVARLGSDAHWQCQRTEGHEGQHNAWVTYKWNGGSRSTQVRWTNREQGLPRCGRRAPDGQMCLMHASHSGEHYADVGEYAVGFGDASDDHAQDLLDLDALAKSITYLNGTTETSNALRAIQRLAERISRRVIAASE